MAADAKRAHDLFEAVLDVPASERSEYLDVACGGDSALHAEVARLLADSSPTDDFLERPALAPMSGGSASEPPRFRESDVLAGRFRIERFIGRGGMGEVYQALDLELGSRVALKTLRTGMDERADAIDQFRREVLRARSVAHPNVCRVYDLFAHQDPGVTPSATVRFLTMELLQGETLARRLAVEGPFSPEEALPIGMQVASALGEAHRLGIVHRDLKPSNIVLVDQGGDHRAVVTDFGLALRLAEPGDEHGAVGSERAGGTEGYMAPEQRAMGALGPPADVYAFGVVLHEMLTGALPGQAEAAGARVPAPWAAAISACLQFAPGARPKSASDALRGLRPASRRRLSVGVVSALAALLTVALYLRFSRLLDWTPDTRPGAEIVLASLVNDTGESDLNAITELFRQQLRQSPFLNVVDPAEVKEALRHMARPPETGLTVELAREVAWRRGSALVGAGRVWRVDRGYGLSVRVEERPPQPDVPGPMQSTSYEARDRAELQRVAAEAAAWLRGASGEARSEIPAHDRPVQDVTTSSWQALSLFSRAEELISGSREEDGLALLAEAVRLDPDFTQAWMRMGDVLMSRRQYDEAYERWHRALAVSERRKLTGREDYRIRGMFASDTGDYVEAERVFRLYLLSYPNDPAPYFYIARPLLMLGRIDDAIRMLEEARSREPRAYRAPAQLAMYSLRAGRLDAAAGHIASLRAMGQAPWAECIEGARDFLVGKYDSALRRFESLEGMEDRVLRSRAPALQAAVLAERGEPREAIARLQRGAAADAGMGAPAASADKLLALGYLLLRAGEIRDCRDACLRALQLDRAPQRLIQGAALLARAGDPGEAERWLARLPSDSFARNVRAGGHRVRGEILLARHDARRAWSEFQEAARLEAAGVLSEYLARGAEAAGEHGLSTALYERMASDPGYYWRYPDSEPPGVWGDALAAYLRVAAGPPRAIDSSVAEERYRRLRPASSPKGARTTMEAQK
jgi:serine/threonine protein kinase/Tfp pilus assembly protein PilF